MCPLPSDSGTELFNLPFGTACGGSILTRVNLIEAGVPGTVYGDVVVYKDNDDTLQVVVFMRAAGLSANGQWLITAPAISPRTRHSWLKVQPDTALAVGADHEGTAQYINTIKAR